MMQTRGIIYSVFVALLGLCGVEQPLSVAVHNSEQQKMKLMVYVIEPTEQLRTLATIIKKQLACSLQKKAGFVVHLQELTMMPSKDQLKSSYQQGFSLVVCLSAEKNDIYWRIYDSFDASMVAGKKVVFDHIQTTAHHIADALWYALTGQEGIFSTYLAYCQEVHDVKQNSFFKNIYLKHPFDTDTFLLVQGGKPLAPRWNNDSMHPLLLYSETTPTNVRLMSVTMEGKRRVISNFEGLNMLPSFSQDGCRTVYCLSKSGKSQLYLYTYDKQTGKTSFSRITHNEGNNISPTLRENGDIVFCSDFQTGNPQIFYYHAATKECERLTHGGYCACPNFSEKTGKIAYGKMVQGVVQIFLYDLVSKRETQVTSDYANKDECCWSPCGNYLAYTYEQGKVRRIAVLNLITKEQFFVTKPGINCSYPAWSPTYKTYVSLTVA